MRTGVSSVSESEESSEEDSSELSYVSATKTETAGMTMWASAKWTRRAEGLVARLDGCGAGSSMVTGMDEGATGCEVLIKRSRDG